MEKVSFIIPSRGEKIENLSRTIKSIEDNVVGEHEIIVGFDGPPYLELPENIQVIQFPNWAGIKTTINSLAACATGKYLFKLDAHCSVSKGIDEILKADMQENWIVMPRFYVLKKETWEWQDNRHYDYFYLCCPFTDPRGFRFKAGGHWPQRTAERENDHQFDIDETPQIHGSGWFMEKNRFFELGGFPLTDLYGHAQEPLWLAARNWFIGGKVMVNKKCWYAHLHQETRDKGFNLGHTNEEKTYNLVATHFMNEPKMEWFIEKFMPMPTWTENWRELISEWRKQNGNKENS
jgi:glycosyltransferase involved in cell wall biosynthesis